MSAERFADQPLYAVPADGIADCLCGNGQTQPCCGGRVEAHHERKESIRVTAPFFIHAIEIRFATQALRGCEVQCGRGQRR